MHYVWGPAPSIILSSSRHRAEIGDGGFLRRAWNRRRHVRPLAASWLGCGAWRGGDNLNAAPINRVNGRDLVQFHPNSEARTGPWRDSVLRLSSLVFIQWRKILTILQSVYFIPSYLQWFQSITITCLIPSTEVFPHHQSSSKCNVIRTFLAVIRNNNSSGIKFFLETHLFL